MCGRFWITCDTFPTSSQVISIFRSLKEHLAGSQHATDGDMQHIVISWLKVLDTDILHARIDALVSQWDRCNCGDYVEK
jgi:hypothetical protein